ncbi:MAG: sugar transferase [Candidatus Eiseniibacteriota bacterium]|nr:MAG: sugar transferase [Candidatus Eisenbacteria bacterium]
MENSINDRPRDSAKVTPVIRKRRAEEGLVSPHSALVKRCFDFVVSGLGLVCLSPVFLLTALLIKLDSEGPVFYTQMRIGQERRWRVRRRENLEVAADLRKGERRNILSYGSLFRIYKFRTMVRNAEDLTGPTWASPRDPRVTRVGGVLRLLRIDELPQLWNVFKGEMSLVGPRPERPHFVHKFADKIPEYTDRLRVRPGITGLAQVSTLDEITEEEIERKLFLDLHYLRDLRFVADIKILLKTIVVLIRKVFAGRA